MEHIRLKFLLWLLTRKDGSGIEQTVRVHQVNDDGTAWVLHIRQSACSGDCHKCSGCGAVQEKMLISAANPIGAAVGDMVTISTSSKSVLLSAAVLYVIPVVLFFVGYFLGIRFSLAKELLGCGLFALGIVFAIAYDRAILSKKKVSYTITGFAQNIEIEG